MINSVSCEAPIDLYKYFRNLCRDEVSESTIGGGSSFNFSAYSPMYISRDSIYISSDPL